MGIGEFSKSLSALGVLVANVAMMLLGGSLTLIAQRRIAGRAAVETAGRALGRAAPASRCTSRVAREPRKRRCACAARRVPLVEEEAYGSAKY